VRNRVIVFCDFMSAFAVVDLQFVVSTVWNDIDISYVFSNCKPNKTVMQVLKQN